MLHDASSIFKNGIGFGKAPGFINLLKEISFLGGNIFFLDIIIWCIKWERNIELCLCYRRNELPFSVPPTWL